MKILFWAYNFIIIFCYYSYDSYKIIKNNKKNTKIFVKSVNCFSCELFSQKAPSWMFVGL